MLTDRVIEEGTLLVDEDSLSFDIRIPWYRSLPLSCVEGLEVRVDSTSVPAADDVASRSATRPTASATSRRSTTTGGGHRPGARAGAGAGRVRVGGRSRSTSRSASGSPTSWSVTGGS